MYGSSAALYISTNVLEDVCFPLVRPGVPNVPRLLATFLDEVQRDARFGCLPWTSGASYRVYKLNIGSLWPRDVKQPVDILTKVAYRTRHAAKPGP